MIYMEIGGYFGLERMNGSEYHRGAIALNTAGNCLRYIIETRDIKKIYVPYFLCLSVTRACKKSHCEVEYYNIDKCFLPDFEKKLGDGEYLYVVNFYGQLRNETLYELKNKHKNIIVDNAQAFFDAPIDDTDTIYSCRKFFGVPDGAYLYTDSILNMDLEQDISYHRMTHILGRHELGANKFYKDYTLNEKDMGNQPIKTMSKLTHSLLGTINYTEAAEKRNKNYTFLHTNLTEINNLTLNIPYGPFMYPLHINDGMRLREMLIEKNVFVPTLWKGVFEIAKKGTISWDYAENIVALPCDHRYGINEMKYIIELIKGEM